MITAQNKFQCPTCKLTLVAEEDACPGCGRRYAADDGILDFVGGRFDTRLDVEAYDEYHAIGDAGAEISYRSIKDRAADRWPASLGSVVEIGCEPVSGRARCSDIATPRTPYPPMCRRTCCGFAERTWPGSAWRLRYRYALPPITRTRPAFVMRRSIPASAPRSCITSPMFAPFSPTSADLKARRPRLLHRHESPLHPCHGDGVRRHHCVPVVTGFHLLRGPADIAHWVAEARRGTMLQGNLALLEGFEDKHMFIGEEFEALALDVGFATAEALSTKDPEGLGNVGGLLARIGIGEPCSFGRAMPAGSLHCCIPETSRPVICSG